MRVHNEKGFALPMTVFLITILTVMLASAFTRTGTEIIIAESHEAGVDALAIAQSGLQSYFGQSFTTRPASGDSIRYNVAGGYAWVRGFVLKAPVDTQKDFTYIVRSTGYKIEAAQGETPLAQRTIAQFADWQGPLLSAPMAAVISANGLRARNNNITIVGADTPTCEGLPAVSPVIGVRASVENGNDNRATISGSPAETFQGTNLAVAQETGVDWETIVNGGFDPDFTAPVNGNTTTYPSQMVTGNYSSTASSFVGQGLLIVTGDLNIRNDQTQSFVWNGIILVGGRMRMDAANAEIYGTVILGLNALVGIPSNRSDIGGGPVVAELIQYHACSIRKTLESWTGFVPLGNTWVDNWKTY